MIAAFAVFSDQDSGLWTAAVPATVGAAGITAAGRFYTWESHPAWIYATLLFAPAVIVMIDRVIQQRSVWLRVAVSGLTAAASVAACVWQLLL